MVPTYPYQPPPFTMQFGDGLLKLMYPRDIFVCASRTSLYKQILKKQQYRIRPAPPNNTDNIKNDCKKSYSRTCNEETIKRISIGQHLIKLSPLHIKDLKPYVDFWPQMRVPSKVILEMLTEDTI